MPSLLPGFEYDVFVSYRQNDNRSGWVTEFVKHLNEELATTIKDPVSVYFDSNPVDGLLETHHVDKSLEAKLKCLILIPILSQTYCDPKSFAWLNEFCAFNKFANGSEKGRDIMLGSGNVSSRILPVKIHDLDQEDLAAIEHEIGGVLRSIEFIYSEPGVNRPLKTTDSRSDNQNRTDYRNQVNKVANSIKEIIQGIRSDGKKLPLPSKPLAKSRAPEKSIVVLPFVNLSNDPEQEYFSDGLTEEIITDLSQLKDLLVISRSSTMTFKSSTKKIAEIASELNVQYVLEGSVRKSGNNLRITAQLIDAEKDSHIWAEKYQGSLDDVFEIQEKVSRQIAESLTGKLTVSESAQITRRPINNAAAYDLYLRGRYELLKWTEKAFDTALAYFRGALDSSGPNALLYAGIGYVYFNYSNFGINAKSYAEEAEKYVRMAQAIEPDLPEVNLTIGMIKGSFEGDVPKAIGYLNKVLEVRPNDFDANFWLVAMHGILGRAEMAILLNEKLLRLEPTNPLPPFFLGVIHWYAGVFELAEPIILETAKTGQSNVFTAFLVTHMAIHHRKEEGLKYATDFFVTESKDCWGGITILFKHALSNDRKAMDEAMTDDFVVWARRDFQYSHFVSMAFALIGDKEVAFDWLQNAAARGMVNYKFLSEYCPTNTLLKGDKRYDVFMVGVKKEWERLMISGGV